MPLEHEVDARPRAGGARRSWERWFGLALLVLALAPLLPAASLTRRGGTAFAGSEAVCPDRAAAARSSLQCRRRIRR
jgi:hypothetical protein